MSVSAYGTIGFRTLPDTGWFQLVRRGLHRLAKRSEDPRFETGPFGELDRSR